jgi:hypothetical protein
MTADNTLNNIISLTREITGKDVIRSVETYEDPDYGKVILITVDLDAKEALELWLKLTKQFPYTIHGIVIGVKWLGENNITENELIDYIVKIMVESGLKPKVKEPFDIVKELREERDKR